MKLLYKIRKLPKRFFHVECWRVGFPWRSFLNEPSKRDETKANETMCGTCSQHVSLSSILIRQPKLVDSSMLTVLLDAH